MKGKLSRQTCIGIRSCGFPKDISHRLINQVNSWIEKSGPEWTCQRLKTMKTAYIQGLAHGKQDFSWIAHAGGSPKGVWKHVFRSKKPQKALSALMVYSSLQAKVATKSQKDKFYSAVKAAPVRRDWLKYLHPTLATEDPTSVRVPNGSFIHVPDFLKREIRVPYHTRRYGKAGDCKTTELTLEVLLSTAAHPLILKWFDDRRLHKRPISDDIGNVIQASRMGESIGFGFKVNHLDYHVGRISYIQEPGYKLRAIANPFPIFNLALSQMSDYLYHRLASIAEDCTFDQEKGVRDIQSALKDGMDLFSIDLSDATNRFPWELTYALLSRMKGVLPEDLILMDRVSRALWHTPEGGEVRFTKGQPLGLLPSFAAFALSHHSVVRMVKPSFYRILGDDIVIDGAAGERLLKVYSELDLPISNAKSVRSNSLAEFAGKVILQDQVLYQPKFKDLSDNNFLELVRRHGPSFLGALKPRQRKVIRPFLEMPSSLHPLALGFNPKGRSWDDRAEEAQPILDILNRTQTEQFRTMEAKASECDNLGLHIQMGMDPGLSLYLRTTAAAICAPQTLEDRVLQAAGVHYVDALRPPSQRWRMGSSVTSDPRGPTLLSLLEKKMGVRKAQPQGVKPKRSRGR